MSRGYMCGIVCHLTAREELLNRTWSLKKGNMSLHVAIDAPCMHGSLASRVGMAGTVN